MVVNPFFPGGQIGGRAAFIELAVNIPADFVGFPFDGIDMKIIGKFFLILQTK